MKGILSNIVKENGHLDILCNNAGIGHSDDVEKLVCINLVSGTALYNQFVSCNAHPQ